MYCSAHPTSLCTRRGVQADRIRIHLMRMINMMTQVIVMMLMTLRGVIVAVAIPVIATIELSTGTLVKRSRIVMRYDLLLKTIHKRIIKAI